MSEYKASQFNQTIASKSTIVPSDHQLEYNAGDTIKFDVPAFMGFIDPRQSYLKMNVKVDCEVPVRFSKTCGVQSVINNLRIYDGTQTHQIENLENYAERLEKEYHYSQNPSVLRKRQLTEGVEPVSSAFNFTEAQLFNGYTRATPFNSGTATRDPNSVAGQPLLTNANTIEVCLPLSSGVLGGNKIFPSALTQGLKVEIDTNNAKKVLELWDKAGLGVNDNIVVGANTGTNSQFHFGIKTKVGGGVGAVLESVNLFTDDSYENNTTTGYAVNQSAPWALANLRAGVGVAPTLAQINAETANVNNVRNLSEGGSNLLVGQSLFGVDTAGLVRNFGVITSVEIGNAIADGVRVNLDQSYTPAGAGDVPGILGTTALVGDIAPGICWCGKTNANGDYIDLITNSYTNYRLSNIELVLKTAQPPKSYVDKLMKQTMSEDGAEVDIMTYQTMRNNIQSGDRMSQINLPSYNERVVGIYCLPMNNGVSANLGNNNLETTLDTLENYQFIVNGTGQPTRRVDTKPYTNAIPTTAQVALWETEKALTSSKIMVRNLKEPHKNFMVARALARYGGVYDLKADGSISLKQEYSNPVQTKLMISFIGHLRRIVVSRMGMSVEL